MRRTGTVPEIAAMAVGDHLCWSVDATTDSRRHLVSFTVNGLLAGERVVFYSSPATHGDVLREDLALAGYDPDQLVGAGRLVLHRAEDAYLSRGRFDADQRIAGWRRMIGQATADGWRGLRIAAELDWVRDVPGAQAAWPAYELRADLLAAQQPFTVLCCFDCRVWADEELGIIRAMHPLASGHAAPGPRFRVTGAPDGSVRLSGELDYTYAHLVRNVLARTAGEFGPAVFDVSDLEFADAAGMRAIATAARAMASGSGVAHIRGASPVFRSVWRILRFEELAPAVVVD
jgi:anti-anti-sigma factor